MDEEYLSLTRAGLDQNYLHANSTTHEFLFGALAELVDNARDAAATKINVFTQDDDSCRGGFTLNFLDDGEGMDPADVSNIVQFGRSSKRTVNDNMIGQYGNGLKSGSMRIGSDFILFTKRGRTMTCLMLSRSFYERERIQSIIVPIPSWESDTRRPILQGKDGKQRYVTEISLITKYSPFKTERDIMRQFDYIKDRTGTLIVIYNMKLLDSGLTELDVRSDTSDIRMSELDPDDKSNWPERVSFKAYVSVLYLDPRMKVYIQGKKVHTKRLADCLYKPKMYKYSSTRFKKRSEDEVKKSEREHRLAEERAREAESVSKDKEMKLTVKANPRKAELVELRQLQDRSGQLRSEANYLKKETDRKRSSLKEPKTLDFVFGFNIHERKYYGMFIYNCNRLIRMYERVGAQIDSGINCAGIIGVVNVPYLVLEPTHNKQHFADNKEFRHLLKAMGDNLQCYWRDSKVSTGRGIMNFWEGFGYLSGEWDDNPSDDSKYQRARAMHIPRVIQCDACRKWRVMPFQASMIGNDYPENWICSMNADLKRKNCTCSEERPTIPLGEFRKEGKTVEQKRMEKENKLIKIQDELKKISKVQTVTSSRDAQIKLLNDMPEMRPTQSNNLRSASNRSASTSHSTRIQSEDVGESAGSLRRNGRYNDYITTIESDESEEEALPRVLKRRNTTPTSPTVISKPTVKKSRATSVSDTPTVSEPRPITSVVGDAVEVNISGKWRLGRVVMVKTIADEANRWRIKFDQYPQDRFDKWVTEGSTDVRFVSAEEKMPNGTTSPADKEADDLHENAHMKLRTCLRYFLPPQWKMPKEEINNLTLPELCEFPMDDFFDHYEKGLRKLVSNFRTQADQQKSRAEELCNELQTTQQLLYNVLKRFDEDIPDLEGSSIATYAQEFLDNNS